MISITQGNTVEIELNVEGNDITNWKVRAELWDISDKTGINFIRKATTNSGGSNAQIEITDPVNGLGSIKITKGETADFGFNAKMEIELEKPTGELYTVYQEDIEINRKRIKWAEPAE